MVLTQVVTPLQSRVALNLLFSHLTAEVIGVHYHNQPNLIL